MLPPAVVALRLPLHVFGFVEVLASGVGTLPCHLAGRSTGSFCLGVPFGLAPLVKADLTPW